MDKATLQSHKLLQEGCTAQGKPIHCKQNNKKQPYCSITNGEMIDDMRVQAGPRGFCGYMTTTRDELVDVREGNRFESHPLCLYRLLHRDKQETTE